MFNRSWLGWKTKAVALKKKKKREIQDVTMSKKKDLSNSNWHAELKKARQCIYAESQQLQWRH